MYGCESWTIKKAEHWRIDAFELWCWRRLLRVPLTARRSNQSILKEISPGISLEGMMLKLKLQYFGHLMGRVDSLEKTDAGRDWGQEEKGTTEDEMAGWHRWVDGRESEWTPGIGDGQEGLACCNSWGHKESDTTERLNWTERKKGEKKNDIFPLKKNGRGINHLGDVMSTLTPSPRRFKNKTKPALAVSASFPRAPCGSRRSSHRAGRQEQTSSGC